MSGSIYNCGPRLLNKETGYKQKPECRENIGCELQCGMEETGFGTRLSKV